jgi:hypothetical protein
LWAIDRGKHSDKEMTETHAFGIDRQEVKVENDVMRRRDSDFLNVNILILWQGIIYFQRIADTYL